MARNSSAWPEGISKETVFPNDDKVACFSCKAFYTSGMCMLLIPSADLTLDDLAEPVADLTNSLGFPAIKINVIKYASLVRGHHSCIRNGSLFCCLEAIFFWH